MAKVLVLTFFICTTISAAPSLNNVTPNTSQAQVPTLDGRIVGGSTTTIANYPYQASLLYFSSHICGAVIISTTWVITAAHCTSGSGVSNLSVRVGTSYRNTGGSVHSVTRIIQHGSYSSTTLDFDISVLQLASAITDTNARSVGLTNTLPEAGVSSVVTGWGTTLEGGTAASQLQVVEVPVVSQEECRSSYGESAITDRMICAGLTEGGKDSCQGDSGGPLVTDGTVTGLVSWGHGCARPSYPGVYTSIPSLRTWISTNTGI